MVAKAAQATEEKQEEVEKVDNAPQEEGLAAEVVAPTQDPHEYTGWIKMTHDEMVVAQDNGVLMGYHPGRGLGLVKHKETKKK